MACLKEFLFCLLGRQFSNFIRPGSLLEWLSYTQEIVIQPNPPEQGPGIHAPTFCFHTPGRYRSCIRELRLVEPGNGQRILLNTAPQAPNNNWRWDKLNLLFLPKPESGSGSPGAKEYVVYTRVYPVCAWKKSWPWGTFRFLFLPLLPALGLCWMDETILKHEVRPTIWGKLVNHLEPAAWTWAAGSWHWLVCGLRKCLWALISTFVKGGISLDELLCPFFY